VVESNFGFLGQGRLLAVANGSNPDVKVYGNTNPLTEFLEIGDTITFKNNGNTIIDTVDTISGNVITLTNDFYGNNTANGVLYTIYPDLTMQNDYQMATITDN
jgi:hypothetical protein